MESSLGARLRAQREQQQISLSAISAETKIKLLLLEGLERDDVSQWPEGIYRRAYVRSYARAVGLDPEELVREFLQVHPDPVVAPPPTDQTELETPHWPAEFRRLVNSALAVVPARRTASEPALVEPPPATAEAPRPPARPILRREDPDLLRAAEICEKLGRAPERRAVTRVLDEAARGLDAVGAIVWGWDGQAGGLKPAFSCGYSAELVARMPLVRAEADNGIASAFRSAQTCIVPGDEGATGAVIVPLLARGQCVGVLAIETRSGGEQREAVRAFAAILAAQFVPCLAAFESAEAINA